MNRAKTVCALLRTYVSLALIRHGQLLETQCLESSSVESLADEVRPAQRGQLYRISVEVHPPSVYRSLGYIASFPRFSGNVRPLTRP